MRRRKCHMAETIGQVRCQGALSFAAAAAATAAAASLAAAAAAALSQSQSFSGKEAERKLASFACMAYTQCY